MTVIHHIGDDLLMAYEAGSLAEGFSLAVATHLALCPACRKAAAAAAKIGGALLDAAEAEPVTDGAFAKVMTAIRETPAAATPKAEPAADPVFPEPLCSYLGGDAGRLRWRRLGFSAKHLPIATGDGRSSVRLLRIPAGQPVPEHGHGGPELTLVLQGCLVDGELRFHRGDVECTDETVEHQPSAGPGEDCVCLAVTDAPLRFKSRIARLAQPFLRI